MLPNRLQLQQGKLLRRRPGKSFTGIQRSALEYIAIGEAESEACTCCLLRKGVDGLP